MGGLFLSTLWQIGHAALRRSSPIHVEDMIMKSAASKSMTLGNMRANGVRALAVHCEAHWCNHHAVLDVSDYTDDVTVPAFGPRMVCTVCGAIGADVRPNWNERAPVSLFGTKR
jgi:hypothetical protein